MELQFKVLPAAKCTKKDVISAIDIYCKSVDSGSMTDTNQIKDYIWNSNNHNEESRTMFFYLLFGNENTVDGFAEFGYLPQNQVLVLDYLCTCKRNHVLFYNFYHMVIQEIEAKLKRKGQFIRYIITELSLKQANGKLLDADSNYFRQLLSTENYILLKYPYYQPPLFQYEQAQEFNLAMKLMSVDNSTPLTLDKEQYLSIINELYYSHYLSWYRNFQDGDQFEKKIDKIFLHIKNEIIADKKSNPIALVQCKLFDEGQCDKFTAENITLTSVKKKKWKKILTISSWVTLSILTFIVCFFFPFNNVISSICSFFTIIAGIISIIAVRKDIF